jgi:hypothetical protein
MERERKQTLTLCVRYGHSYISLAQINTVSASKKHSAVIQNARHKKTCTRNGPVIQKQQRQCRNNVTLRRVLTTTIAVEKH